MTMFRPLSEVVEEAIEEAELRATYPDMAGLRTGIRAFDEAASAALVPGRLVVVAGESGRGKTAFAAQIVAAFGTQTPVLWLSLEDEARDAVARQLANVGRLNVGDVRSGKAFSHNLSALGNAACHLAALQVDVADGLTLNAEGIAQLAWIWKKERNVETGGVIVIDQLSHIAPSIPGDAEAWARRGLPAPPPVNGPETNRLEWQVGILKIVALKLGVTIVLLHQLNEAHGKGQEPDERSIRSSRGITHKADLVVIPWVPAQVKDPFAGPGQSSFSMSNGEGYLIGVKARTVDRFKVPVRWDGAHQRWADREVDLQAPYIAPAPPSARALEGARKLAELRAKFDANRQRQLGGDDVAAIESA